MDYKKQFKKYLNDLAAKTASPGGGSAASLSACIAISLIQMALRFSNKKNASALRKALIQLEKTKSLLFTYIDKDAELFLLAMKKESIKRKKAINDLNRITFDLGIKCITILRTARAIKKHISKGIESDFAIGQKMALVSLQTAIMNLEANERFFASSNKKKRALLKRGLRLYKNVV